MKNPTEVKPMRRMLRQGPALLVATGLFASPQASDGQRLATGDPVLQGIWDEAMNNSAFESLAPTEHAAKIGKRESGEGGDEEDPSGSTHDDDTGQDAEDEEREDAGQGGSHERHSREWAWRRRL